MTNDREREVLNIWDDLSARYYGGRLPRPRSVRIVPGSGAKRLIGGNGWARIVRFGNGHIRVDMPERTFEVHPDWLRACILHEMVHAQIGVGKPHTGDAWKAEVRRLSELGALQHVI